MNSIIIGQTLEIPQLIIQELSNLQTEVVVHSIVATTTATAVKLFSQLHSNIIQLNGLTFVKTDKFIIFVAALDQIEQPETVLLFLYLVSQYMHFQETEIEQLSKLYEKLPLKQIQNHSPKISSKYSSLLKIFKLSKKHLKLAGKPKMIIRYRMTGTILLSLMLDFCEYQNTNKKLNDNFFVGVFKRECYRKYEDVRNKHHQQIVKIKSEQKIFDTDQLLQSLQEVQQDTFLKLIDCVQCSEISQTLTDFLTHCKENQKQIFKDNFDESEKFCSALLQSYLNLFNTECSNIEDVIQQKDIYIKQKWASFEEILDGYLKDAQGPHKHKISEQISTIIFQQCDQWFEALNSHYMFELNKCKAQLLQTVENFQELQNRLAEVESKKFELENMNQGLMFELESSKRETEKITRLKELTDELIQKQTKELQDKLKKTKEKSKNYKEGLEKAQEDLRKITYELNEKKKEQINSLVKVQQLEKALDQTIQRSQQDSFEKELITLIQQFKEKLELASRDSIPNFGSRQPSDPSSFRVLEKLQTKYDKVKEKCKQLEESLTEAKETIDQLQRKQQEDEITISKLNNELQTRLSKEESDKLVQGQKQFSTDLYQVLSSHKTAIEQMNAKYSQLQNDYYQKSIELSDLEFQRGNTLTILREALKAIQKKPNTLLTILRSMPPKQQQEIKDVLNSTGLKI